MCNDESITLVVVAAVLLLAASCLLCNCLCRCRKGGADDPHGDPNTRAIEEGASETQGGALATGPETLSAYGRGHMVHQLSYIDIEPGCLVFRIYIR